MDGFNVEKGEEATGKRRSGDPRTCSHVHARHRRSKRFNLFLLLHFIFAYSVKMGDQNADELHF